MRLQVFVPTDLWEALCTLATKEYRTPRQQLGLITNEALRQVLGQSQSDVSTEQDGTHATHDRPTPGRV